MRDNARPNWRRWEWWVPLVVLVVATALWEGLARTRQISTLFFPPPSHIAATLLHLVDSGELWRHVRATLSRVLSGLLLGGLPGLLLGWAMGGSRRLRVIMDPLVAALHPLPKVSLLPLIMIIFGIGETSKVVAVAVGTFFPMLINTLAGVRQIEPIYFEVARNYGARPWHVLTRVMLPGSLPLVLTGMRLALNTGLLITIAVELVMAREGLGEMIWFAWETLRTEKLYAALAVLAVLGIGFNVLIECLASSWVPWQTETHQ